MLTIQRTRGVAGPSEAIAVIERAPLGGYEGAGSQFADRPSIVCEVWPGGSLPVATTLPAAWDADTAGLAVVDFPEAAMTGLSTGRYRARIRLSGDGTEIAWFGLAMTPGPGDASPRPAYHTYDDLLSEWPMVEKFASKASDQTGFAYQAAKARSWIDVEIARESRYLCGRRCGSIAITPSSYPDALAADHLILDSPEGRQIVDASVYKTLAIILRRAEIVALKSEDIVARQQYYEALAEEMLSRVTASFAAETGLPPVRFGRMQTGRVVR